MDWRALGLGLTFVAMWSSAFTSSRIVVAHVPPFLGAFGAVSDFGGDRARDRLGAGAADKACPGAVGCCGGVRDLSERAVSGAQFRGLAAAWRRVSR